MCSKISLLKLLPRLPGASGLNRSKYNQHSHERQSLKLVRMCTALAETCPRCNLDKIYHTMPIYKVIFPIQCPRQKCCLLLIWKRKARLNVAKSDHFVSTVSWHILDHKTTDPLFRIFSIRRGDSMLLPSVCHVTFPAVGGSCSEIEDDMVAGLTSPWLLRVHKQDIIGVVLEYSHGLDSLKPSDAYMR